MSKVMENGPKVNEHAVLNLQLLDSKDFFSFFFTEHKQFVARFIARRSYFDQDDILNEVFLIAWRKWNKLPTVVDEQRLWLYGIARRVIANKQRWKARLDKFNLLSEPLNVINRDPSAQSNMSLAVHEALGAISPEHREVLMLTEWDQLSTRDVAKMLQVPETTITKRLHAARHTFAAAYTKLEPSRAN